MTQAFIFLTEGYEEIEAITIIDVLRRGGVAAKFVSLKYTPGSVTNQLMCGSRDIYVIADLPYPEFLREYNAAKSAGELPTLVMPGGPGTKNYRTFDGLEDLMREHAGQGGRIAAICAAPSVLDEWGILDGKTAVCYPALQLNRAKTGTNAVEIDGQIITSQGPATTMLFAIEILRAINGSEGETGADQIAKNLLLV